MRTNEQAKVILHEDCGPGYRLLVLAAPQVAADARPGQFVHVKVPALESSALRRPFSIFNAEDGRLEILYKAVGRGTFALNGVRPGESVEVLGPLGRGFPETCRGTPLLVGGGYGVAPLYFLARRLLQTPQPPNAPTPKLPNLQTPNRPKLFVGGRTKADLLALDRFAALGVEVFATTNDGSFGTKGFAVVPLDEELARLRAAGAEFELFTCGPDGLLKAVAERAVSLGAPGWISVDRHMVCGVGACYACIQKTVTGNARCCVDGPVFKAEELVW